MTSSSGFPICLSGIQILPQIYPSSHRRFVQSHTGSRARHSRRMAPDSTKLAECRNASSSSPPAVFQASPADKREPECNLEAENSDRSRMCVHKAWPRCAVATEMAELDRRREALKKQRRIRNLLRDGDTVDRTGDYRIMYGRTSFILAFLEAQSKQQDASNCTEEGVCAKAA